MAAELPGAPADEALTLMFTVVPAIRSGTSPLTVFCATLKLIQFTAGLVVMAVSSTDAGKYFFVLIENLFEATTGTCILVS